MNKNMLKASFKKHNDEYGEFDRVENKLSRRPDLHAFLLLDSLVAGTEDMVSAAEHDVIYLQVDFEDLANSAITEEQVRDLVRCGVMHDEEFDCLSMFA